MTGLGAKDSNLPTLVDGMQRRWLGLLESCRYLLKWAILVIPISIVIGSASAFFLWALDRVTELRWNAPWLLYLLPLAGVAIVWLYYWLGGKSDRGNNLILDEIHRPSEGIELRMAPLILFTTLVTHLFGGSAGREGTAVQMGASLSSTYAKWLRLNLVDHRILLMVGIAAGFGGVFGTPISGAIFALEVLAIGRLLHIALIPCLVASVVSDWTCTAWGIGHTDYHQLMVTRAVIDWWLLAKVALVGISCGLVSYGFSELLHAIQTVMKRTIPVFWLRPVVGGLVVIVLVWLVGSRDYLGIGVYLPPEQTGGASLVTSFSSDPEIRPDGMSWFWKLVFTAVTIGSGFKGGEVTPLFFIGATFGNCMAWLLDAPVDIFAAIGLVAVFAGATNTPIACTLMGVELFGAEHTTYLATACFLSYLFSGHGGIYSSQPTAVPKTKETAAKELDLPP